MEIQEFNLQNLLIPKVEAQSYDGLSQPTFGLLDVTGDNVSQAQVNLVTDNTSVSVGETFVVEVEIETGDFSINEYQIVIDYDQTKLSVLDAEPDISGTQIEFQDLIFQVDQGDNLVEDGRITLIAGTDSGNALQVNRTVANITFQSQEQGNTVIEPVTTFDGTKLINQNGIAINSSLNSLTLNIGNATSTTTTTTTTTQTSTTSTSTTSTNNTTTSGPPAQIPAAGLTDDLGTTLVLFGGVALMVMGIYLYLLRKKLQGDTSKGS